MSRMLGPRLGLFPISSRSFPSDLRTSTGGTGRLQELFLPLYLLLSLLLFPVVLRSKPSYFVYFYFFTSVLGWGEFLLQHVCI